MKVTIISRETIKPSSKKIQHLEPHKLCLLDQLFPLTYATGVLFYPNIHSSDPNFSTITQTLAHLKKSLSETLNLYYPFSGRIKDDIYVDDFDAGVPFIESRVECRLSEYFKLNDAELLNKLVPFPPFRRESNEPTPIPLLAIQANVFSCGGIALGASFCHKVADGTTMFYIISCWAALHRGSHNEVIKPDFSYAPAIFPPVKGLPEKYSALMDRTWFKEGNYVTKRFVFSAKAVEILRERARSESAPKPTRNEAVSCFIWKHVTESSWHVVGSRKAVSLASQAVNVRGKLRSENSIGNLFWMVMAVANTEGIPGSFELYESVDQLKKATEEDESEFRSIAERGYKEGSGSEVLLNKLDRSLSLLGKLDNKPVDLGFSNWKGYFNYVDFGWGKPFQVGAIGKVGPAFWNHVFLVDSQWGKGIEATVILEEKLMAVLERDAKFLAFASPNNPGISSL